MTDKSSLEEIITPYEMHHLISSLTKLDITLYGSTDWLKHHEKIEKLNNQGHRNALNGEEKGMVEDFVTGGDSGTNQVETLIHDLLVTEAWKDNVFPIVKKQLEKTFSLKTYILLYHEATVANLIEVLMYHQEAAEECQDSVLELVDYCYRKLVWLMSLGDNKPKDLEGKELLNQTREDEMKRQYFEIQFSVAIICISIIRFISDNLSSLNIPIVHQMMEINDLPLILVPLLEEKPWVRINSRGDREIYEDQKWIVQKDIHALPKVEAQIWLTLFSLFMCQDAQRKYEVTSFRKSNLLCLKKFLNEVLLNQLPILTKMLRSLEELQLMQDISIPSSNPFMVQVIPEIRNNILKGKSWKEIANYQIKNYFSLSSDEEKKEMKNIMSLYTGDMLEDFLEQPKCGLCGNEAKNRCSKCKHEWYCSRDCQIKAWKGHK